jgi:hypothetical protein
MSTGTICLNCEDFIDELRQRPRQFIYAIVAEPDAFVLYKAYTNNGTVRLAEFKTLARVETLLADLPPGARRLWL